MDDEIPPEDEPTPFSDDSENFSEDEFPEKSSGEEMIDEEFQVSDIPQEREAKAPFEEESRAAQRPDPREAMNDEAIRDEAMSDEARMGHQGDEAGGFDAPESAPPPIEEVSLDQVDVSKVPIRIDLELTRVKVSLSELQKLEPGQKLPIDVNPRIVNLVTGGKTIGRGEVVDIGDTSCVKILELY